MKHSKRNRSDSELLQEKIKDIRYAMLTTAEADGSLHGRPMMTLDQTSDGDLWFFTLASTTKVAEVSQHRQVNISYARPEKRLFVSVTGTAQLVHDRQKIEELWKAEGLNWFPDGKETEDLALLRVTVEWAEFWEWSEGKGGLLHSLFKSSGKQEEFTGVDVKLHLHSPV